MIPPVSVIVIELVAENKTHSPSETLASAVLFWDLAVSSL